MAELSAVPFSELPSTDDGYTLLNDNGIVHKSSKKLSELVDDKTSSFLTKAEGNTLYQEKGDYLVEDDISGKLDKSQYAIDSATFLTAHQDISNKLDTTAFSTVSGNFLTEQNLDEYATQEWVNNKGFLTEHQPISADEWNDVYETVSSNSGTWGTETNWEPDIISASNNAYNSAVEWVKNQNYLTEHQDISNKLDTSSFSEVSSTFLTNEDITGKMDNSYSSNFYPMESNPSGYLTEHQSLDDYATKDWVENKNYLTNEDIEGKLDTSSFSDVSGSFLTAHQDISNKMDKSESANFYPMTGNPSKFLTEHQNLDEYATQEWVNNKGFLTAHQPISANEWNNVYETVVANSGIWGTETNWEPDIISASNNAYNSAVEWVKNQNYLTEHQDISNKLDTSSFSDVSGSFLTAHQDISNKMDKSESANFYPMTGNPSGFLTEHQNLDEYATINYVDTKIGEIGEIGSFEVVNLNKDDKPDVNEPSTKIIYLTKEIDSEKSDPYTEWIYNDTTSAWECICETTLDLVNYYKKNETSGAAEISGAIAGLEAKISKLENIINTYSARWVLTNN